MFHHDPRNILASSTSDLTSILGITSPHFQAKQTTAATPYTTIHSKSSPSAAVSQKKPACNPIVTGSPQQAASSAATSPYNSKQRDTSQMLSPDMTNSLLEFAQNMTNNLQQQQRASPQQQQQRVTSNNQQQTQQQRGPLLTRNAAPAQPSQTPPSSQTRPVSALSQQSRMSTVQQQQRSSPAPQSRPSPQTSVSSQQKILEQQQLQQQQQQLQQQQLLQQQQQAQALLMQQYNQKKSSSYDISDLLNPQGLPTMVQASLDTGVVTSSANILAQAQQQQLMQQLQHDQMMQQNFFGNMGFGQ